MVRYVMISEMLKGGKYLKTDEIYPYILIYVDTFVRLYVYTYANIHIHRYIAIHTHTHNLHIHTHTPNIHISQLYSKPVFWTLLLRIPCVPLECLDLRLTEVSQFIQTNFLHVAKWKCFLGFFFFATQFISFPKELHITMLPVITLVTSRVETWVPRAVRGLQVLARETLATAQDSQD